MVKQGSTYKGKPTVPNKKGKQAGIDLARLCEMHPRLPAEMASLMVVRAGLGLQRNRHSSGVDVQVTIEKAVSFSALAWPLADLGTIEQHDSKRITEDGAEAIALALAYRARAWCVVRRLQQGYFADWIMEYQDKGVKKLVALEVGGTDHSSTKKYLSKKMAQVAQSTDVDQRCAGIVGFQQPEVLLKSMESHS